MFKLLKAKNFFSWEELEFQFTDGITLITGENKDDGSSEGSGKSSVLNALSWGLYGQIPGKDITVDEVIREGAKTCNVEILLASGHSIVRTRSPNDLYIINPDGKKEKGKDAKETQKQITNLLGMSFDTFAQSVYFAQNYTQKFITATQEEKVRVLSEIQDLSWCDKASKRAYDRYKEISLEINKLEYTLKNKEEAQNIYKAELKTFNDMNSKFSAQREEELKAIKQRIDSNAEMIKNSEAELAALGKFVDPKVVKAEITTLEEDITQLNVLVAHITAIKQQYEAAKGAKECPTCGQPICREVKEPEYPEDPDKVFTAILERKKKLENKRKELADFVAKESSSKEIRFKINYLTNQNLDLENQYKKLNQSENIYITKIKETEKKLETTTKDINNLHEETNRKHKVSESLKILRNGFKELKSHVFKNLLVQLNYKANKYIQEFFDVPASICFTNVSEDDEISKIVTSTTIDGNERSLGLLSGGQFRRVQIAVDFALSEIVSERSGNPINIRILDEPFKDLSEIKMEKVIQILEKMRGCTIIIEHNSMIKSIVNKVFNITLQNGISFHS